MRYDWDEYRLPGTASTATVEWGEATLVDEQGTWDGPFFGAKLPKDGPIKVLQFWLAGSGTYEGLYAVLTMDNSRGSDLDIEGLIVEGEMPAFASAATE